ncbi:MAG: cupredoxin domain-containing protein [Candidatus Micrarchaeota archaeon]
MNAQTALLVGLIGIGFAGVGALFFFAPSASASQTAVQQAEVRNGEVQVVEIVAYNYGYDPQELRVKKGIPVELRFRADKSAGCDRILVLKEFGVNLIARDDKTQVARFTPQEPGEYVYRCGMNMFRGKLIVE